MVPRDILSILRSTDVPPMQLEVRRTPSTIKRSNSAVLAREKEFERACQDEERLVLQMPHFVGLSASSQNILMTTHRVPATEMTCEYKRGELIFPNATTEADAPDNSVIVGIVLSGYVELTFDAWLDEEEQEALRQAQANTASSMSVFAAAAAAASATSAAPRRTKPRPRPGVKEFGGMIFEPYSCVCVVQMRSCCCMAYWLRLLLVCEQCDWYLDLLTPVHGDVCWGLPGFQVHLQSAHCRARGAFALFAPRRRRLHFPCEDGL